MTHKLLFLDIDGTILKPDHTYTDLTKKAIFQAKEQDIEVFLATGRPIHEIGELAKDFDIHSLIGYNGAYAIYQDETIVDEPMDGKIVERIFAIAKEKGHEMVLYTSEKNHFTSLDNPVVKRFIETFQLKKNHVVTSEMMGNVLGLTLLNVKPSESSFYELTSDLRVSPVHIEGAEHCYDVIRESVNKGEAIRRILERLNISKEQAIAFGDGMNDKEMLQTVGAGFAMGNAHPDLFAHAKRKTTTVEESGIYYGLKELGLVR